jgi:hypothetical protein
LEINLEELAIAMNYFENKLAQDGCCMCTAKIMPDNLDTLAVRVTIYSNTK